MEHVAEVAGDLKGFKEGKEEDSKMDVLREGEEPVELLEKAK